MIAYSPEVLYGAVLYHLIFLPRIDISAGEELWIISIVVGVKLHFYLEIAD